MHLENYAQSFGLQRQIRGRANQWFACSYQGTDFKVNHALIYWAETFAFQKQCMEDGQLKTGRFASSRFALTQSRFAPTQSRFARSFINAIYGVVGAKICFIFYISFLNIIPVEVVHGGFANVSLVRQRPVR